VGQEHREFPPAASDFEVLARAADERQNGEEGGNEGGVRAI